MKGIIETSVYLVIFALVCFFSIDFIRINQRVSDAGEISQYIENYIEAYCGDIPDSELSEEARDKNLKVFLLGAKEETLIKCKEKIKESYDGINIVGSNNGFFDLDNCDDLIEKINESKADILFVAMGAPRQEVFIEKYKDKLCCKIFMGVGGSFDVFAGNVNRAPQFMINIGMEWLYRVAKEPWRIKRLGSIPKFLVLSLKERGKR